MNTALLIIDLQNDYFPAGRNPLEGSPEAAQQAGRLLEQFRTAGRPVFHVQHLSVRPGATFFLPGTPGAEIYPRVQPRPGEPVIQKHYPNSFRETDLLERLRQASVERLVVCGMMTHMCVDASVRAAADLGFTVWLVQDACATKALAFDDQAVPAAHVHAAFLAALNGTYARVIPAEDVLAWSVSGEG